MPVALAPSSAAGLLALLAEPDPALQLFALEKLDEVVGQFWPEISEEIVNIETLSESTSLPTGTRQLAALLLSKLYFHLGAQEEALSFALLSGERFERERKAVVDGKGKGMEGFVEVVTAKALDTYILYRQSSPSSSSSTTSSSTSTSTQIAPLEQILLSIISHSLSSSEPRHALGLALEARRADLVRFVWEDGKRDGEVLKWVLELVGESGKGGGKEFRVEVLELLLELIPLSTSPSSSTTKAHLIDYPSLVQIHIYLNRPSLSAELVKRLLVSAEKEGKDGEDEVEKGWLWQVGFDLAEGATQEYLGAVEKEVFESASTESESETSKNLRKILSGETSIRLYLDFLYKNDKKDLLILKTTKDALESRSSMYHSALTLSHAFMSSGTTSDTFLRENLDFLSRAANWSKFTATSALGVINKGSLSKGRSLLGPYLPGAQSSGVGKEYSEGGALFAVGLVNAGRGGEECEWLKAELGKAEDEVVKHGAALGLGVAGMGSGSEDIYDILRETLFQDSAIAGEASGYAMGLTMLGSGNERCFEEMIQYAHETQHEKIIRGLSLGMAFLWYGKEEEADGCIERLMKEKDAILRYGGMYTIALAYAGTSNNAAIRKLLDVAVSDVSDDVRRAAVTALGFVLCRNPTQVPRIVQLLSESYNPHVRQGAAIALGVACAGTGLAEAVELLEPLSKDPVDFVRQGALISLSMVLIQQSAAQNPTVTSVRAKFASVIGDKHEDSMAKFGAALAQGIIDAGGRNVTVSLVGRNGLKNLNAVVGMALFCQFWYWFPLAHCLSLGFAPTALIGLDKNLKIPKFDFVSKAKPSLYAYPPPTKVKEKEEAKAVATAVLSTTAKANARAQEKKKEKEGEAMDTDDKPEEVKTEAVPVEDKMDEDVDEKTALLTSTDAAPSSSDKPIDPSTTTTTTKKTKSEASSETLPNMSRVTPSQASVISFAPNARYVPIKSDFGRKPKGAVGRSGAGAAGIVIVVENPAGGSFEGEREFIELEKSLDAVAPAAIVPAPAAAGDVEMGGAAAAVEDGPEREPPSSFEYPFGN